MSLYKNIKKQKVNLIVRNQLLRAGLSIVLNLAEGNNRLTSKDRKKFFNIAFTSLREVQAIIDIESLEPIKEEADILAAHIYKLITKI